MRKILKELSDKLVAARVSHYFSGAPLIEAVECFNMREQINASSIDRLMYADYVNSDIVLHVKVSDVEAISKVLGEHNVFITTSGSGYLMRYAKLQSADGAVQYMVKFAEYADCMLYDYYEQTDPELEIPMRCLADELYCSALQDGPWSTYHVMQLLHWGFANRFKSVSGFTAFLKERLPYHMYLHLEVKLNTIFNIASYEGIFSDLEIED